MAQLKDFNFHSPDTIPEAVKWLKQSASPLILAGGTFVVKSLKKKAKYPCDVISLRNIAELKGIRDQGDKILIGSMTKICEILDSKVILGFFPSFFSACSRLATTPVRNMATIGGNIASRFYWVDLPAVLLSLNAGIEVATGDQKTVINLKDFFKNKSDSKAILTQVILPQEKRDSLYFRHTRTSQEVDVAHLCLAFSAVSGQSRWKDVRLVVNTTLSFPVFLKTTAAVFEKYEYGKMNEAELRQALELDTKETKLDEFRRDLLFSDIKTILNEKHNS